MDLVNGGATGNSIVHPSRGIELDPRVLAGDSQLDLRPGKGNTLRRLSEPPEWLHGDGDGDGDGVEDFAGLCFRLAAFLCVLWHAWLSFLLLLLHLRLLLVLCRRYELFNDD